MKSRAWLQVALVGALAAPLHSAEFNVGIKKDALTGLKVSNHGLGLEECYLAVDKKKLKTDEVPLGKKVVFYVTGVSGFVAKEGKVEVGASMSVKDKNDKTIFEKPDLFGAGGSVTVEDAKSLSITLKMSEPMVIGDAYTWSFRFWDKQGKGEITGTVTLKAAKRQIPAFIHFEPKGLTADDCLLATPGRDRLSSNEIPAGYKVVLAVIGAKGFTETNGRVFIGASMHLTDADGKVLMDEADLLSKYDAEGITLENSRALTLSLKTGEPLEAGKHYLWKCRWWDKKGKGEMTAAVKITLVDPPE